MNNVTHSRNHWAAIAVLVVVFVLGNISLAAATEYCTGPNGSACSCPEVAAGLTCTGQYAAIEYWETGAPACFDDPRPCSATEHLNCDTGQCVCDVNNYPCSGCTAPQTTPGTACDHRATDAGDCADLSNYVGSCGQWQCDSGWSLCSATNTCTQDQTCPDGMTWNVCTEICEAQFVILNPDEAYAPQPGNPEIEGNFTIFGDDAGEGDLYMSNGKAIRIDGTGGTTLNIGNWGGGGFSTEIYGSFTAGDMITTTGNLDTATGILNLGGGDSSSGCTVTTAGDYSCTGDFIEGGTALSSKYLGYGGMIQNNNPFGPVGGFYIPEIYNQLHRSESRFLVSQTGFDLSFNSSLLFNNNYENACRMSAGGTSTVTIDFLAKGEFGANGYVYPGGYIYAYFYWIRGPANVSGRVQDKDGVWRNMTDVEQLNATTWRLKMPSMNYATKIELTFTAQPSQEMWLTQLEYYQLRPNGAPLSAVTKYNYNSLYSSLMLRDTGNNVNTTLDTAGNIDATGDISIGDALCLRGDCITDWMDGFPPGTSNGDTLRWNGTNWVSNSNLVNTGTNVGVGVSTPLSALHIVGAGGTNIDSRFTGRMMVGADGGNNGGIWLDNPNSRFVGAIGNGMGFYNNAAWRLVADDQGRIGIGTITPAEDLHIQRAQTPAAGGVTLLIENTDTSNWSQGEVAAGIEFKKETSQMGYIRSMHTRAGGPHSYEDAGLVFGTAPSGSATTNAENRMVINAQGLVGIGDIGVGAGEFMPQYQLDVRNGKVYFDDEVGAGMVPTANIGISSSGANYGGYFRSDSGRYTYIASSTGWGVYTPHWGYYGAGMRIGQTADDGKLVVRQDDAGDIFNLYDGATNVMTVLDGGNVGIGTTAPAGNLDVVGTMCLNGDCLSSWDDSMPSGLAANDTLRWDGSNWLASSILNNDGTKVRIARSGVAGQYQQFSGDAAGQFYTAQSVAGGEKPLVISNFSAEASPGPNNEIRFNLGTSGTPNTVLTLTNDGIGVNGYPAIAGTGLAVQGNIAAGYFYNPVNNIYTYLAYESPSNYGLYTNGYIRTTTAAYLYGNNYFGNNPAGDQIMIRSMNARVKNALPFRDYDNTYTLLQLVTPDSDLANARVGIKTESPAYDLDVNGDVRITGSLTVEGGGVVTGTGTTNMIPKFVGLSAIGDSAISEVGGNVGIGTASPATPLHVNGATGVRIFDPANVLNQEVGLQFGTTPGNRLQAEIMMSNTNTGNASGDLVFKTNSGASLDERMRITKDGGVGIGTTNPAASLHVASTANPGIQVGDGSTGYAKIGSVTLYDDGSGLTVSQNGIGADLLHVQQNGIDKLVVDWDGNTSVEGKVIANGGLQMPTGAGAGLVLVSDATGNATWTQSFGGSGTSNYVAKFIDASTIGDSVIYDDGTNVGIGTNLPSYKLHVAGTARINSTAYLYGNSYLGNAAADRILVRAGRTRYRGIHEFGDYDNAADVGMVFDAPQHRLGIGSTLTPDYSLDIQSDVSSTLPIVSLTDQDGTRDWTGLRMARGATPSEIWFIGMDNSDDSLRFRRFGSADDMYIDSSGVVTIGGSVFGDGLLEVDGGSNSFALNAISSYDHSTIRATNQGNGYALEAIGYNSGGARIEGRGDHSAASIGNWQYSTGDKAEVVLNLHRGVDGTSPSAGIGGLISFGVETSSGSHGAAARIGGILTDVNTSFYDGAMVFYTSKNGIVSEQMRLDSDGNLGVGTTNPTYNLHVIGDINASSELCINGDCRSAWPSSGSSLAGSGTQYATAVWSSTSNLDKVGPGTAGQLYVSQGASANPSFVTMSGDATMDSSGNVIVANSSHTHDASNITSGTLTTLRGGTGQSAYTTGDILYASSANVLSRRAIGSAGDVLTVVDGVPTWVTPPPSDDPPPNLNPNYLMKYDSGNGDTESVIYDDGTNIGIGTTSPSFALDVALAGRFGGNLVVKGYTYVNGGIRLGDSSSDAITSNASSWSMNNNLDFDSGTFYIDSTNNRIGIGTTTPTAELQVIGDSSVSGNLFGNYISGNSGSILGNWTADSFFSSGNAAFGGATASSTRGLKAQGSTMGGYFYDEDGTSRTYLAYGSYGIYVSIGSAAKPGGGSWSSTSDRRTKKDVSSFDGGLELISQLQPVNYTYNGLAETPEGLKGIGFIAQDIMDVVPWMVGTTRIKLHPDDEQDSDVYFVDPSSLPFINLNAIKELQEMIGDSEVEFASFKIDMDGRMVEVEAAVRELEEQNEKLKAKTKELEGRLEQLEWQMLNN